MTATVRRASGRRVLGGWLAIVLGLVLVGGAGALLVQGTDWSGKATMDPASAAPSGARALAETLADHGIEVTTTSSYRAATEALTRTGGTLVMPDAPALSDGAVHAMVAAAQTVVFTDPRSRTLRMLDDDARAVGVADDALTFAACSVDAAVAAGSVRARTVYSAATAEACFPAAGGYALLVTQQPQQTLAAVDGAVLFSNETIARDGNAALALTLMGSHDHLVWYVPSLADSDLDPLAPTLGDLTPEWVTPVMVVLLAAAGAAALWRGVRFGPLLTETLPVTARATETTRGRASLYAQSRDPAHAAHLLRRGTRIRLSHMMGLSGASPVADVADAVAEATGMPATQVREWLEGPAPTNRRALDDLYAALRELESRTRHAVHPREDH